MDVLAEVTTRFLREVDTALNTLCSSAWCNMPAIESIMLFLVGHTADEVVHILCRRANILLHSLNRSITLDEVTVHATAVISSLWDEQRLAGCSCKSGEMCVRRQENPEVTLNESRRRTYSGISTAFLVDSASPRLWCHSDRLVPVPIRVAHLIKLASGPAPDYIRTVDTQEWLELLFSAVAVGDSVSIDRLKTSIDVRHVRVHAFVVGGETMINDMFIANYDDGARSDCLIAAKDITLDMMLEVSNTQDETTFLISCVSSEEVNYALFLAHTRLRLLGPVLSPFKHLVSLPGDDEERKRVIAACLQHLHSGERYAMHDPVTKRLRENENIANVSMKECSIYYGFSDMNTARILDRHICILRDVGDVLCARQRVLGSELLASRVSLRHLSGIVR
jgi:hypothetical protein